MKWSKDGTGCQPKALCEADDVMSHTRNRRRPGLGRANHRDPSTSPVLGFTRLHLASPDFNQMEQTVWGPDLSSTSLLCTARQRWTVTLRCISPLYPETRLAAILSLPLGSSSFITATIHHVVDHHTPGKARERRTRPRTSDVHSKDRLRVTESRREHTDAV